MDQRGYMLALHRRCNITALRWEKFTSFFARDWQKAYEAKIKDWQAAGFDARTIEKFFATKEVFSPSAEQEKMHQCGAEVLTISDEDYPIFWHNLAQPPALIFYRGNVKNLSQKSLSVVGSRNMTEYGNRCLQKILRPVFSKGITVVSGLAFGVDAAAHQLALDCHSPTVAVLGNGIDFMYPRNNNRLGLQILECGGTVISEHLPGTEARAENFPKRNRLVASLGQTTVVVEAALKSGSLITAGLANDCAREVWAIPGDVFRTNSAGCNRLISRGEAAPLLHSQQLIESLRLENTTILQKIKLSNEEKLLVKILGKKNTWDLDEFLAEFSIPANQVSATLTLLELKNVIQKQGNRLFLV